MGLEVSNLDTSSNLRHDSASAASPVAMAMSMNSWISGPCVSSEHLSGLRQVMGVTGPKSADRALSGEEWEAISLYMCVVWTKVT